MATNPPNIYMLKPGIEYDDMFPLDFADVMWQAFEKDRLESFTIKLSKPTERITMRVIAIRHRNPKIRGP